MPMVGRSLLSTAQCGEINTALPWILTGLRSPCRKKYWSCLPHIRPQAIHYNRTLLSVKTHPQRWKWCITIRCCPSQTTYKHKVKHYQRLLQQEVQSDSLLKESMNTQTMKDTVGADNSSLAGNWEVSTKTVGTLPATSVAHLKPGDALPNHYPSTDSHPN